MRIFNNFRDARYFDHLRKRSRWVFLPTWGLALLFIGAVTSKADEGLLSRAAELRTGPYVAKISSDNGALLEFSYDGISCAGASLDKYRIETISALEKSNESNDRVVSLKKEGGNTLLIQATNSRLSGVKISKEYRLDAQGILRKRIAITSDLAEKRLFTWEVGTVLGEGFKIDDHCVEVGITPKKMIITSAWNSDRNLYIGATRWKVNDRYVLPAPTYTSGAGWQQFIFHDFISSSQPVSGEWLIKCSTGDYLDFDSWYTALDEYKSLWKLSDEDGSSHVVCDAMYLTDKDKEFFLNAMPQTVTSTIWFLNPPWGNWWADSAPPVGTHPDMAGIAPWYKTVNPNAKVSAYTCFMFDDASDIFRDHQDLGVTNKDGKLMRGNVVSDYQGRPSFIFNLSLPECKNYLLDMHSDRFTKWDFDFHYTDGPGYGHEEPCWRTFRVTQNYDWIDFLHDLLARLKTTKSSAFIFSNGVATGAMPFSRFGYMEWRAADWQAMAGPDWRRKAFELMRVKLLLRPEHYTVGTYGSEDAQPMLAVYGILYGYVGNLQFSEALPFMRAAMENRTARLVPSGLKEQWWKNPDQNFEAYTLTNGDSVICGVVDHENGEQQRAVTLNSRELGLPEQGTLNCKIRRMNTDVTSWRLDGSAWTSEENVKVMAKGGVISLNVPTAGNQLTLITLKK